MKNNKAIPIVQDDYPTSMFDPGEALELRFVEILIKRGCRELKTGNSREIMEAINIFEYDFKPVLIKNPNLVIFLPDWREAFKVALFRSDTTDPERDYILYRLIHNFEPNCIRNAVIRYLKTYHDGDTVRLYAKDVPTLAEDARIKRLISIFK